MKDTYENGNGYTVTINYESQSKFRLLKNYTWFAWIEFLKYIFNTSSVSHLLCFEEGERIFSSYVKKYGYFCSYHSRKGQFVALYVQGHSTKTDRRNFPTWYQKTPLANTNILRWVRIFNIVRNVGNRAGLEGPKFPNRLCKQSISASTRTEKGPSGEQLLIQGFPTPRFRTSWKC